VIPGSAVSYAPYGDSVFVIDKKKDPKTGKETQTLRPGFCPNRRGARRFCFSDSGIEGGRRSCEHGSFKLRNGMPVTINNDLAPKPQMNPTPADS